MSSASVGAPAARGTPLLRQHDFRRLWIGETASSLGSSVTSVALPLVALTVLHAHVFAVSVLAALAWIPWVVIGLPAGAWVDRLPRRPLMMTCDVVSLLAFASIPVAALLDALTMAQLFVVAVLGGVAEVFFSTAYRALLPALLDDEDLVAGNSQLQASESAAQVAGPAVAGLIAQAVGAALGIVVDAVSFAVSWLCLARIRVEEKPSTAPRRALRTEIAEGLRFVRDDRLLRVLLIFGAVANVVLGGYGAISVAYLVRDVGLGSGVAGLVLAIGQAGGIGGALLAPSLARRVGSARALILCKVATTPVALLIPFAAPGWRMGLFLIGQITLVAGIVGGNVIQRGFSQAYCPPELMGRVNTSTQVFNFGAIPVGAVTAGVLASTVGYRPAMWILLGGFVLASSILLAGPIRSRRDLPTRATCESTAHATAPGQTGGVSKRRTKEHVMAKGSSTTVAAYDKPSSKKSKKSPGLTWLDAPAEHDYPSAASYLNLVARGTQIEVITSLLSQANTVHQAAKDILRAAGLALLPPDDPEVAKDLVRVAEGTPLSPVLLVRGDVDTGRRLVIADGYHRVCSGYHLDEKSLIPCRIVDLPSVAV